MVGDIVVSQSFKICTFSSIIFPLKQKPLQHVLFQFEIDGRDSALRLISKNANRFVFPSWRGI